MTHELKNMNKATNFIMRLSETDKQALKELAKIRQMSMSELVVYMIRREAELYSIRKKQ